MTLDLDSRIWFYYAGEQQVGPIPLTELKQAVASGKIGPQDYVYREGFQDWKLLTDVSELTENEETVKHSEAQLSDKRGDLRVSITERVIAHNDSKIASGSLTDISISGVFFNTSEQCFDLNEEIKITLKEGRGLGKPMHLKGTVVRRSDHTDSHDGYGLELKNLDETTRQSIVEYVKRNQAY